MDNTIDLLQIKIGKAKTQLPENTLRAIDAVPWQAIILKMRETKGYSFEQLGDLEIETELLLCGLLNSADYPKELEAKMKIPRAQVDELVNEMNELVFKRIRQELMKQTSKKGEDEKISKNREVVLPSKEAEQIPKKVDLEVLKGAGIELVLKKDEPSTEIQIEKREEMLGKIENPELMAPKILTPTQSKTVKTEYSLNNLSKDSGIPVKPNQAEKSPNSTYTVDPYRLSPDE